MPAPGYSLTHAKAMLEDADWLSGDHRLEGVLIAIGPEVTPGPLKETAELIDLAPTAMAALGVPSGIPRDGKVLETPRWPRQTTRGRGQRLRDAERCSHNGANL